MFLVDSNVLLDLVTEDKQWLNWSLATLENCRQQGILAINPIIFTEVSIGFQKIEDLNELLTVFKKLPLTDETCFLAGKVFKQYKKNAGTQKNTLPDFFIGAHASLLKIPLITRDLRRYKTYFPQLVLIHPPLVV